MTTSWTSGLGGGNPIRYVFVDELHTAINSLRTANGLSSYSWTSGLAAGNPIRAIYFSELQEALNDVFVAKKSLCPMFGRGVPLAGKPISAQHLLDLREWVNKLEDGIDPRFGAVPNLSQAQCTDADRLGYSRGGNPTGRSTLTWNYTYNWNEWEHKPGIGTFYDVGGRFGGDDDYQNSDEGVGGRGSTRFMDTTDSLGVTRYADPDYLNELPDGAWFRASGEPDNHHLGGANDNATDYHIYGGEPASGWRGRGQFPTLEIGTSYDGTNPTQYPGRLGESFAVQPERFANWFYKYWDLITAAYPHSRLGFTGLTDAGRRNKSTYLDGANNKPAIFTYDGDKKYEWLDAALDQLDDLFWDHFQQHANEALTPDNFFWALHFYPDDLEQIGSTYYHKQSDVDGWIEEIKNFITHVRNVRGFHSDIPTLITEFGSISRKDTDDVDRVDGMEKMIGDGEHGLRSIPACYNVVAWFWFPGDDGGEMWPYSGLFKSDGTLSDPGIRYKELAGA